MHPLIRPVEAILPRASRQYGMKARNLAVLSRAGFPVPAAYVLSSEGTELFFKAVLPPEQQLARLYEAAAIASTDLDAIRDTILQADVPGELREALRAAFVELHHAGAQAAVLRPSRIVAEDMEAAVAGLHEATLALGSVEAVIGAAKRCWASLYTPAAIHCARTLGPDHVGSLALVVQAMVPAEASGVLWTANPLTNDAHEMTLEAVFGLGLGLRDATITPDLYQIDRRTNWIRDRVVGRKTRAFGLDPTGALHAANVDPAAQHREALDDHTLKQMVELGRRIEAHFGDPREIEWAVVADAVYVVHARPIAARPGMVSVPKTPKGRDERDLANAQWVNLGVVEPLSDVVTPLTWSAINTFCGTGLQRVLQTLGVESAREIQGVRSQRGRAYVDASELSLLGSIHVLLDAPLWGIEGASQTGLSTRELAALPMQLLKAARHRVGRGERLQALERQFHAERARLLSIDPRILSGVALADTTFDAQRLVDRLMRQLMLSTSDTLASWSLLRRVLQTLADARARALELGLLCAIEPLYARDPVAALDPLIVACRDVTVRDAFPSGIRSDLAFEQLAGHPSHAPLAAFLSEHGHRASQELELASPRWSERPGIALLMACSPVALDASSDAMRLRERARGVLAGAERELAQRCGGTLAKVVMRLVHTVRQDIAQRDAVRDWLVQSLQLLRRCVVEGSRRLSLREAMVRDDAAFLLSLDELRSHLRGEIRAVAQLVGLRRSLQRQTEALPSPPDSFVGYPQPMPLATQWTYLRGAAVSPGVARGPARIVTSFNDAERIQRGDVLVLRQLDPAWAPLMCRAAAVCSELGGSLSPGAVLLRQYAIPTVSGVGRALRSVRNGELLRVDADHGAIDRVPEAVETERTVDTAMRTAESA